MVTPSLALSVALGGVHVTVAVDELVSVFWLILDGVSQKIGSSLSEKITILARDQKIFHFVW